jgi:spore coat polysaccharide biosynthesis protein SpsF
MKVVAILQARCNSTRLPNKVLKKIMGKPMVHRQISRIKRSNLIDELIVATSDELTDSPLEELCAQIGTKLFRGSLDNVLDRFYQTALATNADIIVRLTGDCPLTDSEVIDQVIRLHIEEKNDYTSNIEPETFPDGLDVEVFNFFDLENAWKHAYNKSDLEHVTPYIRNNSNIRKGSYISEVNYSEYRWTVDEPRDFTFVNKIYSILGADEKYFSSQDIYKLLKQQPDLLEINTNIIRNEGYSKSLEQDHSKDNI